MAPRKCTKQENALRTAKRADKSEVAPTLLKDFPHDTSELYLSHPTSYCHFGKDREQLLLSLVNPFTPRDCFLDH